MSICVSSIQMIPYGSDSLLAPIINDMYMVNFILSVDANTQNELSGEEKPVYIKKKVLIWLLELYTMEYKTTVVL